MYKKIFRRQSTLSAETKVRLYCAAIFAYRQSGTQGTVAAGQALPIVAPDETSARERALEMALDLWPLSAGWGCHDAVVNDAAETLRQGGLLLKPIRWLVHQLINSN